MSSLPARTGRHRQLYENGFRLVAGCIPYRLRDDIEDTTVSFENMLEVVMIASPNRKDLVFPKGGWENDETMKEAAHREALEEAGVKGILDEHPLGVWEFRSKSSQNSCSQEGSCKGYMFAMEVTEEFDTWADEEFHRRIWVPVSEAYDLCRYEWMREALEKFLIAMKEPGKCQMRSALPPAVQNMLAEHQISSSNCSVTNSTSQQLDERFKMPYPGNFHLKEELVESPAVPVEDMEHQILSSSCSVTISTMQPLDERFTANSGYVGGTSDLIIKLFCH